MQELGGKEQASCRLPERFSLLHGIRQSKKKNDNSFNPLRAQAHISEERPLVLPLEEAVKV
jgi:hypothetical protein